MITSPPGRDLAGEELREAWPLLSIEERVEGFRLLPTADADDFFLGLAARDQASLVCALPQGERRVWLRLLAPDDVADLIQAAPEELRQTLLADIDGPTRADVMALLAYAEDEAGGLMNPRFARLRPEMTVDEALRYLREQARQQRAHEQRLLLQYAYVLDAEQHLVGIVTPREIFAAAGNEPIASLMRTDVVTAPVTMDQEEVARRMAEYRLAALPVVNENGQMQGIITLDDIVDVVEEEATEDIQKLGGSESLGAPYLEVSLWQMLRKRGGWLAILLVAETLTATAMGFFEKEIASAVVLALFIPLVISSGGNAGSQASTLIIRAMALHEVRLRDWWRVAGREVQAGLGLGVILGTIGILRITVWQSLFHSYGGHAIAIALTVATSLVGIVLWGTLTGSMLPFLLRRLGIDPATASAPFVATLVDVTGLVIYFTTARVFLTGKLL